MYIDASIPKECSDPVFFQLDSAFRKGEYKKLRGVPVYKIVSEEDGTLFYVAATPLGKDAVTIYGWINIAKKPKWECWTVDQVFVFPQVRGDGWGKLLYDTVIDKEGLILASGYEQSRLGRRMWKTMIKSDRYTIWAHDFNDTKRFADVVYDPETDKIYSKLKIYQRMGVREDVRLIAIKKTKRKARK